MHLLDTTTKQLKTFYGEEIPGYAILSHMWGKEEDEVLFRHIAGSDADKRYGKKRKGYAKIEGACKQAVEDGWEYIWIDTCCIDKTSSAELSEAINSMFDWYWKSGVCYVYLEDVSVRSDRNGRAKNNEDPRFPIVPFERSRWFTRGWTLQELIAPEFVVFYSKDWMNIGTKASLQKRISDVTRIRVEMLIGYDPEKASVAEKISWAAFRKTTRTEDAAYCLMGLLRVNMPLLYGEGNRAFRRLQEEFMKVSDDDSLFAWKSHLENYSRYLKESRGMLANTPWEFRDGANIARSKDGAYSPYSMTNQGLQIKLPLDPKLGLIDINSENTFKTILKCTTRNTQSTRRIVIYLKKTPEGYYQRIFSHWLDETETPPNEKELTTLLIPQADAPMARNHSSTWSTEVKILPTESRFTVDGHSLKKGYTYDLDLPTYSSKVGFDEVVFKYRKKAFKVVVGLDNGIPWLDFSDVVHENFGIRFRTYEEGGSCTHLRERHLNRLSEKIPGGDWWLIVSMRRINDIQRGPRFRTVFNIQRDWDKGQDHDIPPAISASDNFFGHFPNNLDHHDIHPDFKKESYNWVAVFNPKVRRVLDVDLVYRRTITHCGGRKIDTVQFSRDGKYFATCSYSGIIQVYNMETSALIFEEFIKTIIFKICFSPDGKFIAAARFNEPIIDLWDIGAKPTHKSLFVNRRAASPLCFSLDSNLLIASSQDTIHIWEVDNDTSRILTICSSYEGDVQSIAVSPNNHLVAIGGSNGIIQIYDIATTRLLEGSLEHGSDVSAIVFTPDGRGLVSGGDNGIVKYWDTSRLIPTGVKRKFDELNDSGTSSMVAKHNLGKGIQHGTTSSGYKERITSVAISDDGKWVISASIDGFVLFWDLSDATIQFILKSPMGSAVDPAFRMIRLAGNTFITSEGSGTFQLWRYNNT